MQSDLGMADENLRRVASSSHHRRLLRKYKRRSYDRTVHHSSTLNARAKGSSETHLSPELQMLLP